MGSHSTLASARLSGWVHLLAAVFVFGGPIALGSAGCSVLTETDPSALGGSQGPRPGADAGPVTTPPADAGAVPPATAGDASATESGGDPDRDAGERRGGGDDDPQVAPPDEPTGAADDAGGAGGNGGDPDADEDEHGSDSGSGDGEPAEPPPPEDDDGDDEGDPATGDDESPALVACGEDTCARETSTGCCYAGDDEAFCYGDAERPHCTCGLLCRAVPVQCDTGDDCADGQRCCASLDLLGRIDSTTCADRCDGSLVRDVREVCDPASNSCPDGAECVRHEGTPEQIFLCEERE